MQKKERGGERGRERDITDVLVYKYLQLMLVSQTIRRWESPKYYAELSQIFIK